MVPSPENRHRYATESNCKMKPHPPASGRRSYLFRKRAFDIAFSLLLILCLILPMLCLMLWIRIDSKGPAVFRQQRCGRNGTHFTIYKFRTMHVGTPSDCASRALQNPQKCITRAGSILRRTSLDELPQLFNILRGDMSFVGYRPVCTTETELNDLRSAHGVFSMRPGLTGLAQVYGRDLLSNTEKLVLDLYYVEHCSLRMDFHCLWKTATTVIRGEGLLP